MFEALAALGYTLPEALADLVDNCIDAGARNVLIRFLTSGDRPKSLVVVDDGQGINSSQIDTVMTIGGHREYEHDQLGVFGWGLKSASFSQAQCLTVMSRYRGANPVGRRWLTSAARENWDCDVVNATDARAYLDYDWSPVRTSPAGTVVLWEEVDDFRRCSRGVDAYLKPQITAIRNQLGLLFHRFLEDGRISISINVENLDTGELSGTSTVAPLNPFRYPTTGHKDYPKKLVAHMPDGNTRVPMEVYIWPPKSKDPGYTLGGGKVASRQGFYFYRRDRLIQAGGWNGIRDTEPHSSLARIRIELAPEYEDMFRLTVKKAGVEVPQSFVDVLPSAEDGQGNTFKKYIDTAVNVYRRNDKQEKALRLVPGAGVPAAVQRSVKSALGLNGRAGKVAFRWATLPRDEFFRIAEDHSTVTLNARYRDSIAGVEAKSRTDAPVVKALLFLLLDQHLNSDRQSAKARAQLEAWQKILSSAAKMEAT